MLNIRLERDSWGKLTLTDAGGTKHECVAPVRAFPIGDPDHWVSVCDHRGHEITVIENVADLDTASRQVLEDELSSREFIPVIQRVYNVSSLSEPCEWDVETDRGRNRFVLNSEDDVRRINPHRAFIVDTYGIRYLIRDSRELDAASRKFVEWYL